MSACPYANILDPDFYVTGNHQVKLQELRKQAGGPIVKIEDPLTGIPYWAVMGRTEADFIGKHPLIFSSEERTAVPTEFDDETIAMQAQMLVNMDPPKHQKFRRIGRNAFTPKAVENYHETFSRYAREIIDKVASRGQCEFVYDVASELPLMAILDLCGVPKEDRKKIFKWTNQMMFMEDSDMSGDDPEATAQEASANIYLYAGELAKKHAETPLTNIVGALLDGIVENEKLTETEFQLFFLLLIVAGNESTRSVTAHGMRLLMEHPDQLQMLVDNPDLIPDACEEMLRYNAAFSGMRRTLKEDVELGGQQLLKGDKLILHWHSINLDETVFDDPLSFDITRSQRMPGLYREHRAFGIGQHFCLGSHLARMEMHIMFKELLPRLKNPKFSAPVKYVRDYFVNGIKEMQITFDPEASA
ncbi:cytochrome P450 [Candidatus Marimicrobium litorale]|jgi:cholest-4-en-3-one 26-monooxygenase|uniref:Cytochrome P450 n=1 Tax=Candidatus Marimicrobium litorale TaxID=2518991 RepID=A0ABT3T8L3_9GAMM|nr:cytochrome P450 [Candidatus Marimicrobium litorale]MCX2978618.1 cytochrome P450 [Candidatus Marimicrobium litorale]